jgi:hypothetical protein
VRNELSADSDLFASSAVAATLIGVLGGAVLIMVGAAVATNWRGLAQRYTDFTNSMFSPRRAGTE